MILHLELVALAEVAREPQMVGFDTSKHVEDYPGVRQKESHLIVLNTNRKGTVAVHCSLVEAMHRV
jgi:hypothetical protein